MMKPVRQWFEEKRGQAEPVGSWVAMFAAFLVNILLCASDGFGMIYDDLMDTLEANREIVGWAQSIRWIFIFLSSVFVSPFVDVYGCRRMAMILGMLYGLADAISALTMHIHVAVFYISYGVLAGTANGGLFLATQTALQKLFSFNRGLASGLAALGFPIGIILIPLYTKFFLDTYGISGLFLMRGALCLQSVIFACAFKIPKAAQVTNKEGDAIGESKTNDNTQDNYSAVHTISATVNDKEKRVHKRNEKSKCKDQNAHTSIQYDEASSMKMNGNLKVSNAKRYCTGLIDFKPLKNVSFCLVTLHFLFLWMIRLGIFSHLVSCAKFRGIPRDTAEYLLSISGFASLVMTISAAVIMNMKWMNPVLLSCVMVTFVTISSFLCAYSTSYTVFVIASVTAGIADGGSVANLPLLVVHVLGVDRFSRGMALLWTLILPAPIGASAFVGWLVDTQGEYTLPFNVLGASGLVSVVLILGAFVITKLSARREERRRMAEGCVSEETIVTRL